MIENTKKLLEDSGFTIRRELYRANMNANVAQGIYHIYPTLSQDDLIIIKDAYYYYRRIENYLHIKQNTFQNTVSENDLFSLSPFINKLLF
mgnify:CR=1 FL=1